MESEILIYMFGTGILGAVLAHWKKRNKILWFFICAVTTLIGVIIILFMPKNKNDPDANLSPEEVKAKNKRYAKKAVYAVLILIFAIWYSGNIEEDKKEFIAKTKIDLLVNCNNDSKCKENINKNFGKCIKVNLTVAKVGKVKRQFILKSDGLQKCIGK